MKRKRVEHLFALMTVFILLAITGVGLFSAPASLIAAAPCEEAQIVFLIDQSGSMGGAATGSTSHPIPNDKLGLRFYGPKAAIEILGPMLYHSRPGGPVHLARIDFGDRAEVGFPWTTVNPKDESEWKTQSSQIAPLLDPGRFATTNLVGTDPLGAFKKAQEELFSKRAQPAGNCPRTIILLTDGRPDLPGINLENYFKDLKDYRIKFLPPRDHEIYVIAMNDSADNYWPETERYWIDIAGDPQFVGKVTDQDQVGKRIREISERVVSRLIDPPPPPSGCVPEGSVTVEPYLQWVSFTLFKKDVKDHLLIQDEIGKVDQNRKDVSVSVDGYDTPIETIRVERPLPGRWQVKATIPPHEKCDIRKQVIPAAVKISTNVPEEQLVQYVRVTFEFQIVDIQGAGVPLPDYDPRYGLDTKARIGSNTGILDLNLTPKGKNTFAASFVPVESGMHSLEVNATSQDPDGNPIVVMDQKINAFSINPAKLVMLQGPGTEVLPSHVPISITITTAAPSGKLVRLEVPLTITATVSTVTQTQTLQLQPTREGAYSTSFVPVTAGSYRLAYQGLAVVGNIRQVIPGDEIRFDVSLANILRPEIIRPTQETFEATNILGQPTGFSFDFQVVDKDDQVVDPAQVFEGSPSQLLTIRVTDSQGKDRTNELTITSSSQGLFRAETKSFGADQYTVQFSPSAKPKKGYAWAAPSWSRTFSGTANPALYLFALAFGLLAVDVAQWGVHWLLKRSYPLRGWVYIAQQVDDEPEPQVVWRKPLPKANVVRFKNGFGWKWILPWWYKDFPPKLQRIQMLEVRSTGEETAHAGAAQVSVRVRQPMAGRRIGILDKNFILHREEGFGEARDIGDGFCVYLQ